MAYKIMCPWCHKYVNYHQTDKNHAIIRDHDRVISNQIPTRQCTGSYQTVILEN